MDASFTGKIISEKRKDMGMTQKDIAEKLHVSVAAVSKWERGLNFPDLSLIEPLAVLLGISASALLGIDEDKDTEQVIKDVVKISTLSNGAKRQITMKKIVVLAVAAAVFFVILTAIGKAGVNGTPFFANRNITFLPLLFGAASWGFGIASVFADEPKKYSVISFALCSIALAFPVFILDMEVRTGDMSAVEDIVWALDFASISLLLGTVILSICAVFVSRRKNYIDNLMR